MEPGAPRARRLPPLELIVFVVGSSTLGAEIAAARLMAPFFGASTIVWANTIAVVLVALSVGYWFGGRMADRRPDQAALSLLVLVAAALLALVPIVSQPFLSISVSAFDDLSLGAGFGSLLGVLALVAIPVLMLGAVSPWAIRLKLESIEDSGETAGRMYAISTVGSLLGTFLSALLLIPLAGTQRTFLTFALALAIVAAVGLPRRWWLVPLGIAALFAVPVGTVKAAEDGKVIHETDTTYQYARVIDHPDGDRTLELNEGQAIHSLYRRGSVLTGGYWDGYLVTTFATRPDPPRRIAILGFAGGTTARAYARYFPKARIDGVEIDRELFDIGRRWFGLRPRAQLHEYAEDARPFLRRVRTRYDAIFIDAYRQPYIPFYLSTREFFALARDCLTPGGVVVVNVGHPEDNNDLEKALSATMASVFPTVLRDPVESRNTLLLGSAASAAPVKLLASIGFLPGDFDNLAAIEAARIAPMLTGGPVYTDDKAPVEWLIDKSILDYAGAQ